MPFARRLLALLGMLIGKEEKEVGSLALWLCSLTTQGNERRRSCGQGAGLLEELSACSSLHGGYGSGDRAEECLPARLTRLSCFGDYSKCQGRAIDRPAATSSLETIFWSWPMS